MSEYIEAFRKAWYNDQSREEIRYDKSTHAPIWENVWKMFAEWVEKQKGYTISKFDLRRIRVRTGYLNKEPWLFLSRDDAIKSAIYVKIVMCSTGIQVGVDFNEKEASDEKATDFYVEVFDKCFSMLNDGWQIEDRKFSIYKSIKYKDKENAPDEDYKSDFNNLLQEAIKQYEIVVKEFQKNKDIYNSLWWFSFDKIADKAKDIKNESQKANAENKAEASINGKIKIVRVKYNDIFLGCEEEGKKYDICTDANTVKAGLATAFSKMGHNVDEKFLSVFKYDEKTQRGYFVMAKGEIVPIKMGLPLHLFFETIKEVFYEFPDENTKQLKIIFRYLTEESMAYMKKLIGEENIHPYHVPHNRIIFGAPGAGKSWKMKNESTIFESRITRVTFHPEYSYFDFVGSYKPVMTGKKIGYGFVPGPFASILREALNNPDDDYCLIIEEINRARVAAVFGDIFQLLDRDNSGNSEYRIKPSKELACYLATTDDDKGTIDENKLREYESNGIYLPSNLYIWATMNSADQGVYPLDTAFKRRWSMEYLDIDTGKKVDNWNTIREGINNLLKPHVNEDKLMGYYFLKEEERDTKEHLKEALAGKVLMYLFDDAAKPCRKAVFKEINKARIYSDLREKMSLSESNLGIFTGSEFWPGQQEQRAGGNVQNETNTEEAEPDVEQQ